MRRELDALEVVAGAVLLVSGLTSPAIRRDLWAILARTCQATAGAVGAIGIYAEARRDQCRHQPAC